MKTTKEATKKPEVKRARWSVRKLVSVAVEAPDRETALKIVEGLQDINTEGMNLYFYPGIIPHGTTDLTRVILQHKEKTAAQAAGEKPMKAEYPYIYCFHNDMELAYAACIHVLDDGETPNRFIPADENDYGEAICKRCYQQIELAATPEEREKLMDKVIKVVCQSGLKAALGGSLPSEKGRAA